MTGALLEPLEAEIGDEHVAAGGRVRPAVIIAATGEGEQVIAIAANDLLGARGSS